MPITKVCTKCKKDTAIEEMTCANSGLQIPNCKVHDAGAESIPGCDEIYCPECWEVEESR